MNQTQLDILAGALEVDGTLPALKKLVIKFRSTPRVLAKLAEALVGGALPLLEHLDLYQNDLTDDDLNLVADMVEKRARIPGCQQLKTFEVNYGWLREASPVKIRLLRALLPSLKSLSGFVRWHADFDPCFRGICPPHLEVLDVHIDDEAFPSLEVLEAAPALKKIKFDSYSMGVVFQPVIAALHRGIGLQKLQDIHITDCVIGDANFGDFLQALKGSGCADRMMVLSFWNCGIGVEGARALANLLRRDELPALEVLSLIDNAEMGDEGVAALASGLGEAPRTMLTHLDLTYVGMGDVGMTALASVIHQGRMQEIQDLNLGDVPGMTDKGMVALARAIDARGLPKMRLLDMETYSQNYTALGFGALILAFVRGCPEMKCITLSCPNPVLDKAALQTMIQGMLQAAGRTAKVCL